MVIIRLRPRASQSRRYVPTMITLLALR
jgi:hypothetical protein